MGNLNEEVVDANLIYKLWNVVGARRPGDRTRVLNSTVLKRLKLQEVFAQRIDNSLIKR